MLGYVLGISFVLHACHDGGQNTENKSTTGNENVSFSNKKIPFYYEGITELRRGDIIVKPNLNILPGTSRVSGGYLFGHAALVIKGDTNDNPDSLLAHATIIESTARDVTREFQVREIAGYTVNEQQCRNNTSFGPAFTGRRYRLRLNLRESQIDSVIAFAMKQKNDLSTWNAMKSFPGNPSTDSLVRKGLRENWADNSQWYCSLLVWQSVLYVTGIDLDSNQGFEVFPNDLINSPYFNNTADQKKHRVIF